MADYQRQTDWYDPARHGGIVTMIGCGGIGSVAALGLAKLGIPKLRLVDPDSVEEHNIPNQMFWEGQIGQPKAEALAEQLLGHRPDLDCEAHVRVFDAEQDAASIVASGVDSMAARAEIWEGIRGKLAVPLYIDARLGGPRIVLYAIRPMERADQAFYSESIVPDDEADDAPCTRRSIIDVGLSTASLIVRAVRMQLVQGGTERCIVHNQDSFISTIGERETVSV